jgi:hypothetical protein
MTEHRPRPDLHIVDKPEEQPPNRLLPDYPRIKVTITARNGGALWAQVRPYLLNEAAAREGGGDGRRVGQHAPPRRRACRR